MPERANPDPASDPEGVRFGRTTVIVALGDMFSVGADTVVIPANRRGVMGAISTPGIVGLRSLGGSDIERQAMAQAPLELGAAIVTAATGLESRGVERVIHAVVHRSLGEAARIEDVRRGLAAALVAADRSKARVLAVPPLGVDSGPGRLNPQPFFDLLVDETVSGLRRSTLRLDAVVIACRFPDHRATILDAFSRARERTWSSPR